MRLKSKKLVGLLAITASMSVLSVAGVSVAAAAPATFNVNSSTSMSGSLVVKSGAQSTTCTFNNTTTVVGNSGGVGRFWAMDGLPTPATCLNGGKFTLAVEMLAASSGGAYSLTNQLTGLPASAKSPLAVSSNYTSSVYTIPYVNGSGTTNSKITFNNTPIGVNTIGGAALVATGSLDVRQSSGLLLLK